MTTPEIVPLPTTAVHPADRREQPMPTWAGVAVIAVFVASTVVPAILLFIV
ncbi:hypothetical protein LCGC14_1753980 [marine sediment metagenome]|uniref:Uncharacterized protein n=1 Tax=marine sediment metagenome TaxID=412755 RepID=A0A0F9HQF3_9ZZZZ